MSKSTKEKHIKRKLDQIEIQKMAFNEAFQEWLDRKWDEVDLKFGRWSRKGLSLLLFAAIIWFILKSQGLSIK